jgi:hypothetical protein
MKHASISVTGGGAGGEGTLDHSELENLDYDSAGHTGFSPEAHTHPQADVDDLVNDLATINTAMGMIAEALETAIDDIATKAPLTRQINTTSPLAGGGSLEADRTLSIPKSTAGQDGYLSKEDWSTFNGKEGALTKGDLTATSPLQLSATRQVIGGAAVVSLLSAYIPKEKLTANRSYYIRTDGNDNNDGLSDSAEGAFLTFAKAQTVYHSLDCNGYNVYFYVRAGTWTASGFSISSRSGAGHLLIIGDESTPSNVHISISSGSCFNIIGHPSGSSVFIRGFKLSHSGGGHGILASSGSTVYYRNIEFGALTGGAYQYHIVADRNGVAVFDGSYTISGGAGCHFCAARQGQILGGAAITVTVSGTPAFGLMFAWSTFVGVMHNMSFITFSGGATGKRYASDYCSVIHVEGGGPNFFPGDVAGTTAYGGQYN